MSKEDHPSPQQIAYWNETVFPGEAKSPTIGQILIIKNIKAREPLDQQLIDALYPEDSPMIVPKCIIASWNELFTENPQEVARLSPAHEFAFINSLFGEFEPPNNQPQSTSLHDLVNRAISQFDENQGS